MANEQVSCASCAKQFPQRVGAGRPRKYCSDACRDRQGNPPRFGEHGPECHREFTCFWCEATYKPKRAGRTSCCSKECGQRWSQYKRHAGRRATFTVFKRRVKATPRMCRTCQCVEISKNQQRCQPCRTASAAASTAKSRERMRESGMLRAYRKARKLKLRGVSVEVVNPLTVLSRDKWTCQLCGVKTPRKLRGTYEPTAPEVDHILPIAKGGEHSYANTQCACRKCNLAKSATPMGQMRLFG